MKMTAGSDGELQRSAGDRWEVTGEGQAGMIGIEAWSDDGRTNGPKEQRGDDGANIQRLRTGKVVFDFNCGGLFRTWVDEETGRGKVMVFKESYYGTQG
jgi:L-asparaginase